MKIHGLAALAGVLLILSIEETHAQCQAKELNEQFNYSGKGGLNKDCTEDQAQSRKICIASGKISGFRYDVVADKNMVGTSEVAQLDDLCVEATTTGHPKDSTRSPNGLLCQAAERTIMVHLTYCE